MRQAYGLTTLFLAMTAFGACEDLKGSGRAEVGAYEYPGGSDGGSDGGDTAVVCNTQTDPKNCGACGHNCAALPNVKAGAVLECKAGTCVVPATSCTVGF